MTVKSKIPEVGLNFVTKRNLENWITLEDVLKRFEGVTANQIKSWVKGGKLPSIGGKYPPDRVQKLVEAKGKYLF